MNQILLQTKYITIYSLWVAIAVAIIISTYTLVILSDKNHLKTQFVSQNLLGLTIAGILGSRVLALALNTKTYFYSLSPNVLIKTLFVWDKGVSFTGAIIGGAIYLYFICKKEEQDYYKWLDVFVPSTIIAAAIIHIGTFFAGTHYGKPTGMPWGVNFESPTIKYIVPIHPSQIYGFIYSIAVFYILFIISRNKELLKSKVSGIIALSGICIYSFFELLNNFTRGDDTFFIANIRINIFIQAIIIIISGILLRNRYNEHIKFKTVNNQHYESN